jgi:hypothetical protein
MYLQRLNWYHCYLTSTPRVSRSLSHSLCKVTQKTPVKLGRPESSERIRVEELYQSSDSANPITGGFDFPDFQCHDFEEQRIQTS